MCGAGKTSPLLMIADVPPGPTVKPKYEWIFTEGAISPAADLTM